MKIGYARISRVEQNINLQIDALKNSGCEKILTDEITGVILNRPGLNKLFDMLREGDEVVVWRLDRLGRSLKDLINCIDTFKKMNVVFKSLQESIDTSSSIGNLIFHIFGSLAECEHNLISERTRAGMEAARSRGMLGGKPKPAKEKIKTSIKLYKERDMSVDQICDVVGMSKPTFYKYLKEHQAKEKEKDINANVA